MKQLRTTPPTSGERTLTRREFTRRSGGVLVATSFGGSLLAACGGGTAAEQTGTVKMALANSFGGFNPPVTPLVGSLAVIDEVFEPLIRYNSFDQRLQPWMVEAMPRREGDGGYAVELRSDLTFHDGAPVRPSDVIFTYELVKNPDTGSFLTPFLDPVKRISAEGNVIFFDVTDAYAAFPATLSLIKILPEKDYRRKGADGFAREPVGSGPFRLVSSAANRVVLEAFADYNGRYAPELDTITFLYVVDESSRVSMLLGNDISIVDAVPPRDFETLASRDGVDTGSTKGDRFLLLETNHGRAPFDDVRVRQAAMYAIDREAVIDTALSGFGEIAHSFLRPGDPFYVEPTTKYPYDPDRARALLTAAGHGDGLDFELLVANQPYIVETGQLIKEQLSEAGMRVNIKLTEQEAGYSVVAKGDYDAFIAFSTTSALGPDADVIYRTFNYGVNRDAFYGPGGPGDKEYDALLDRGLVAPTTEERKRIYAQAQEILNRQVANVTHLVWVDNLGAWSDAVEGYEPSRTDVPQLQEVTG